MKPLASISACLTAIVPLAGHAAGFALIEQNASGVGTAFAGSASQVNDAGVMFFNPAGLSELRAPEVLIAAHGIDIGAEFSDRGSTLPPAGLGVLPTGALQNDAGDFVGVPNLYVAVPFGNGWTFGIGVNVPFGLKTEYDDLWIGRFQGINSELRTVNINPAISYRVNDLVSVGAGINYQRADAELSNAVLLGPGIEGRANLDVDDDAWGWNIGALFTLSEATRIGVGYRSELDYGLEGDTTVTTLAGTVVAAASGPTRADISMPDQAFLSVSQKVGAGVTLLADLSWTDWNTIQDVIAVNTQTGTPRDRLSFGFEEAWRVAFGVSYDRSEQWTLRGGLAWDESPVKSAVRTVRLPDADRYWVSFGAQWRPTQQWTVDAGYAHLFTHTVDVNLTRPQLGAPASFASTVIGRYENDVDIFSVQVKFKFM